MNFLSNVTLKTKILTIVVALTLPILYLSYIYASQNLATIEAKKLELTGLEYQDKIRPLLLSIATHRDKSSLYFTGDESVTREIELTQELVGKEVQALVAIDKVWGEALATSLLMNELLTEWKVLKEGGLTLRKRDNFEKHSQLVKTAMKLLNHVAYKSGLNTDSDIETSYLVKVTSINLPFILEQISKMRGVISAIATRQYLEDGENATVLTYDASITNALDGYNETINGLLLINPELADKFSSKLENFDQAVLSYGQHVDTLIKDVMVLMNANSHEYFSQGSEAIQSGFEIYDGALQKIRSNIESSLESSMAGLYFTSAVALGLFVIAVLLSYFVLNDISRNFRKVTSLFGSIQNGQYDNEINISGNTEISKIFTALSSMQSGLKESIEKDRLAARENSRIKQALDGVTSSVMVIDADNTIVYLNDAGRQMFALAESDISADIKRFSVDAIVGQKVTEFMRFPGHQESLIKNFDSVSISKISVGGHTFEFTSGPVKDASDNQIGMVVEWTDRTQELEIESEVKDLVGLALHGDLSNRIDMNGKQGFYKFLSQGINDLVDVSERVINDTIRVLSALSQGDLTQKIDQEYHGEFEKLKSDANDTVDKLTDIVSKIKDSSSLVNSAAREISQGNLNLSARTEAQSSSLEETSTSMTQMTSTVQNNAENSKQAKELANNSRNQAEAGGEVVSKAVEAMDKINNASNKIADIISVIDEIAFQTNLLALNAAVEAARAGEQGRGFAVVASEVRNLAGRSATAAKEIKYLIEDSVVKVKEGAKLVNQSGETLNEITKSIKEVDDIIGDITIASQEQSQGIEQANRAILDMDGTTQQNAALVEEISASAESMSEQSDELNQLVEFFVVSNANGMTGNASVERRSSERPWSSNANSKQSAEFEEFSLSNAVGDDSYEQDWEEF